MARDNTNLGAKITLRKHFLTLLPQPHILECFAGEDRKLFNACYQDMDVTALDTKQIKGVLKIDNRKFIASQELSRYNFFDLDAYGSPYELLLNIFHKKQHDDPFVVVITDGMNLRMERGCSSNLINVIINNKSRIQIPYLHRHQKFIIKLIIKTLLNKYNLACTDAKLIESPAAHGNEMFYIGMLCKPKIPQNSQISFIKA